VPPVWHLRTYAACFAPMFFSWARRDHRLSPICKTSARMMLCLASTSCLMRTISIPWLAPCSDRMVENLAAAMLAHAGDGAVTRIGAIEESLYASGTYDLESVSAKARSIT
jgi:hypothetical protein